MNNKISVNKSSTFFENNFTKTLKDKGFTCCLYKL